MQERERERERERETDRQTDRRQTDSMTLAEPTPDMAERKYFSNVLTARVLKSRWTETTRSVERAFDPNTPIFNGENPNASYLRWPAWIIKFQNPQIKMNNNKDQ